MRPTFTATPVIWISIKDDVGAQFLKRFRGWMNSERVQPAVVKHGLLTRMASYGFAPDDADRVVAWLRENGCVQERSG